MLKVLLALCMVLMLTAGLPGVGLADASPRASCVGQLISPTADPAPFEDPNSFAQELVVVLAQAPGPLGTDLVSPVAHTDRTACP
jgi:hypothetical protein